MELDKYSRLKIALIMHKKTLKQFSEELSVNPLGIRWVAEDKGTSARLTKAIDELIESSEIMFSEYLAKRNLQAATV